MFAATKAPVVTVMLNSSDGLAGWIYINRNKEKWVPEYKTGRDARGDVIESRPAVIPQREREAKQFKEKKEKNSFEKDESALRIQFAIRDAQLKTKNGRAKRTRERERERE